MSGRYVRFVDQIFTAHLSKVNKIFNKDDIFKELCAVMYGRGYVSYGLITSN